MFSLPSCLIRFYLILTVPIQISNKAVSEIDYNVYPKCMQQECRQISEALIRFPERKRSRIFAVSPK